MHELPLIATIAAAFTGAWLLGIVTQWMRLSPIVGYLVAGVLIGPHTPGFVGDIHIVQQLAEVGVILLMFGVGLHFHLKDLLRVKGVAIPGAIGQGAVAGRPPRRSRRPGRARLAETVDYHPRPWRERPHRAIARPTVRLRRRAAARPR